MEGPKDQFNKMCITVALISSSLLFVPYSSALNCRVDQSPGTMTTRTISVNKGLSVNLTWHYSMTVCLLQEQKFGYDSGHGFMSLAVKGTNGSMQVKDGLPAHFSGRIEVIAPSSTFVVRNIQYNDSAYQFSSHVSARSYLFHHLVSKALLPRYILNVTGAPSFTLFPENEITVEEGGALRIVAGAEARPPPLVRFHFSTQTVVVQPSRINSFSYEGILQLKNISSQLCGSRVATEFYNSRGSSGIRNTTIKMKLHLNSSLGLQASHTDKNCIHIKWNKKLAGACQVKYVVKLFNWFKCLMFLHTGYNIEDHTHCSHGVQQIERVTLIVSYKGYRVNASTLVTEMQTTTAGRGRSSSTPTSPNTRVTLASSGATVSSIATTFTGKPKSETRDKSVSIPTQFSQVHKTTEPLVTTPRENLTYENSEKSGVRKHEKPSITAIATLGSIIFILLVIVIAMMIKWNLNLQSSNSRENTNSKADGSNSKQNLEAHYMDLREFVERPTFTALVDIEPAYEIPDAKVYVNSTSIDEKINDY